MPAKSAPHRTKSKRRLTPARMLLYRFAALVGYAIMELTWRTARVRISGEDRLAELLQQHGSVVPVFWHQHLLICSRYLVGRPLRAFKPGFMISPSVDGQAPSMMAAIYRAHVVRGSGSYTGIRAVRGAHDALVKENISTAITPDGPRGPRFKFKPGAIFAAQISGKPVVPLAYWAKPARMLRTWDKFIIPIPFAKVRVVWGEPFMPPPQADDAQMESMQREMERRLLETYERAKRNA
jgi:lysophospholipid acyltransferase (LPLAT)-like uncharacterized protein